MGTSLTYKKVTTETISAKGVLNEEAKTLTYVKDKAEQTIELQDLFDKFASMPISLTIKVQEDEELDIDTEEEDYDNGFEDLDNIEIDQ